MPRLALVTMWWVFVGADRGSLFDDEEEDMLGLDEEKEKSEEGMNYENK